jgi:hypothetical protein
MQRRATNSTQTTPTHGGAFGSDSRAIQWGAVMALAAVLVVALTQGDGRRASAATEDFSVSLECSPLSVESGDEVTCTAVAVWDGDSQPVTYIWTPAGEGGDDRHRTFLVDGAGQHDIVVRACVTGADGQPTFDCQEARESIRVDGDLIERLSCNPTSVTDRQQTTCRIAFADLRADIDWTATPNATAPSLTGGIEYTTGFTGPGIATVTARGCVRSVNRPEPRCTSLTTSVTVDVGPVPRITSLRCGPDILKPGDPVACSATVENEPNRLVWSAFRGNPPTGAGASFTTNFTEVGSYRITLTACLDGLGDPRCDEASVTVRVAGETLAPRIRTPGCAPDLVPVNRPVSCAPEVTGSQDRFTWTAGPDASPATASGQHPSFTFSQPGVKLITLRVCVGGDVTAGGDRRPEFCDTASQPITVTAVMARCTQWEVSGVWYTQQANGYNPTFTFQQSGTRISGTATLPGAEAMRAGFTSSSGPVSGTLVGDRLDVTVTWTGRNGAVTGRYTATITPAGLTSGNAGGVNWSGSGPARCTAMG